jgi:hypothetical protein
MIADDIFPGRSLFLKTGSGCLRHADSHGSQGFHYDTEILLLPASSVKRYAFSVQYFSLRSQRTLREILLVPQNAFGFVFCWLCSLIFTCGTSTLFTFSVTIALGKLKLAVCLISIEEAPIFTVYCPASATQAL